MKVSACLVTRGNVDMDPIYESLPSSWEVVIWTNGLAVTRYDPADREAQGIDFALDGVPDLSVYGRYAAIKYATNDLIYVQDDDVIVSDPQAIVNQWWIEHNDNAVGVAPRHVDPLAHVVCNMPPEFRHDFYTDHALVGFGAAFHRDAPARVFARIPLTTPGGPCESVGCGGTPFGLRPEYQRTCDVAFTALTPRVLVDVPITSFDYAFGKDRMWKQPGHVDERRRMLELALKVRDG